MQGETDLNTQGSKGAHGLDKAGRWCKVNEGWRKE